MKYFVIFLVLASFAVIIPQSFGQCISLPCDDANKQTGDDSCPVIHFVGYAWEDCGSIWTWSILGVPLLMIIVAPIGIVLAVVIWRKRK